MEFNIYFITVLLQLNFVKLQVTELTYQCPTVAPAGICMSGAYIDELTVPDYETCGRKCYYNPNCKSLNIINYGSSLQLLKCQLFDRNSTDSESSLQPLVNCRYFEPTEVNFYLIKSLCQIILS